jgi:hypothetical protein
MMFQTIAVLVASAISVGILFYALLLDVVPCLD